MELVLPRSAASVLQALRAAGYEAYVVGGCVRDSLLGRRPGDWDVTTSALPEETKAVFSGAPVIETGVRHGTVAVLVGGEPIEITTYRVDGPYSDGRRPDSVAFTRSLREDLARRDFTVNAMAWSPETGLVDPFGGAGDLRGKIDPLRRGPRAAVSGGRAAHPARPAFLLVARLFHRGRNRRRPARGPRAA